ncbi:MAG: tryptophan synthase subunit alpha [Chloroflexi bacterium]|nr:tryptophan synthase subunit alpha [Chloroflexota bacterium]MCH8201019.1 tryptophan synthase subunit alpha [Chloroflexota bacterium]MCI0814342.1 tryptophan synthase subunit alpha [Chloroflexota bacterium]MCI0819437.1 tryptophan synthase subunit alpha [Chloroflexota bacterium]MCI0832833.1 tryptophan synthase subunit alpha [Chloroflexota bacterium]
MKPGRIEETFARLKAEGRTGFVAFLTVGYPDVESTLRIVPALIEGGADVIELGVPFSDPLADGPKIQKASFHALQQGVTVETCLDVVRKLRASGVEAPIVPMGYYNPLLAYGLARFTKDAAEAGVDGLIIVDLPPEESDEMLAACEAAGLRLIYLVAPTSTEERIREVARRASGFVYCVGVTGVTGERDEIAPGLAEFVGRVRNATNLPIAVGFGISLPKHFEAVARIADAAVIGSAIIDEIARSDPSEQSERLKSYAEVVTGRRGTAA